PMLLDHRLQKLPQRFFRLVGGRLAVLDVNALNVDWFPERRQVEAGIGIGHDCQLDRLSRTGLPRDAHVILAFRQIAARVEEWVARAGDDQGGSSHDTFDCAATRWIERDGAAKSPLGGALDAASLDGRKHKRATASESDDEDMLLIDVLSC